MDMAIIAIISAYHERTCFRLNIPSVFILMQKYRHNKATIWKVIILKNEKVAI